MTDGAPLFITETFEAIYCYKCGIGFAVAQSIRRRWRESGKSFYCPAGHYQHYSESDVERLQKEVQNERKRREWAEQDARNARAERDLLQRMERAQRAAKTRLKNRVANGVCPCCKRSFENLARHMRGQHPEFVTQDATSRRAKR